MKKHIVSVSGGVGSYFTLKRVLEKNNKEDVIAVFMDTLAEDGDLYRFLGDIERKLDIKIIRFCVGKTPIELAFEKKYLWNSRVAQCSIQLKSKPFREWLKETYKPGECILYLGIDWTETHRKDAIIRNYDPYEVEFPMCEKPYLDKNEMVELLKQEGIEIPRLYKLGFTHNNCKGCCVKAGIGQYRNLLLKDRITYLEMENKEEAFRQKYGKDVSILKRKGKKQLKSGEDRNEWYQCTVSDLKNAVIELRDVINNEDDEKFVDIAIKATIVLPLPTSP